MNYIKLAVYQNGYDESALTQLFGAPATQSTRKGEKQGMAGLGEYTSEQDSWILEHNFSEEQDINDTLSVFIKHHLSKSAEIKAIAAEGEICLSLGVYPEEEQCDVVIEPDNLLKIAKCGAQLNVSVTFLGADF